MLKLKRFGIVRLESKDFQVLSWGKVLYPSYTVQEISCTALARQETHHIPGTYLETRDGTDPASAWAKFHRDNCSCSRPPTRNEDITRKVKKPCNIRYVAL